LIVVLGLGNPGDRYGATRHNLGKRLISELAENLHITLAAGKGSYHFGIDQARGLCLAVPTTYMNTSGICARQVVDRFGIGPEDLLVVCDDFNLPLGTIRIRREGSDGGHNGLASVIYQLATDEFPRLRLGVGPVPPGLDPADFVLSEFAPDEYRAVQKLEEAGREAVLCLASDGIDKAMNAFNRRVEP
jgi:PTH1 family peptidyl-tRNA hydrolase